MASEQKEPLLKKGADNSESTRDVEQQGAPPSYDSLFGELKAHKASSAGTVDFAKKAKASFAKRCGGICCLIFTLILIAALLLALPIAETAIGAIHLNDCPAQKYLAIYLIVAGVLGLVSGIFSCGGRVKSHRDQDQREDSEGGSNACSCLTSLIGTFLFAWFIAGNVWVFRMKACVDPVSVNSTDCFTHNTAFASSAFFCDETLYKFVFWEIIAKWIFVGVIFVIGCLGCCICCCVACCSSDKD